MSLDNSKWVPTLASNGFDFHHAGADNVAMVKWLPSSTNQIPPYAHHMVGVGGIVVNAKDEILVVQEKFTPMRHWKLPGGYVDPGENFAEAAVREVKEETGVDCEFDYVVAFRHAHGYNFGCSDIYVVTALKPKSDEITKCEREIENCRWMPLDEFIDNPNALNTNRFFAQQFKDFRGNEALIRVKNTELRVMDFVRKQQVYCLQKL